jgi:hypothetical protein
MATRYKALILQQETLNSGTMKSNCLSDWKDYDDEKSQWWRYDIRFIKDRYLIRSYSGGRKNLPFIEFSEFGSSATIHL